MNIVIDGRWASYPSGSWTTGWVCDGVTHFGWSSNGNTYASGKELRDKYAPDTPCDCASERPHLDDLRAGRPYVKENNGFVVALGLGVFPVTVKTRQGEMEAVRAVWSEPAWFKDGKFVSIQRRGWTPTAIEAAREVWRDPYA